MDIAEKCMGYILGKLDNKEREELELALKTDNNTKEVYDETLRMHQYATLYRRTSEAKTILQRRKTYILALRPTLYWAATLILVSGLSYLLFNKNYLPDIVSSEVVLRSGANPAMSSSIPPQQRAYLLFNEARADYFSQNYQEAIQKYQLALATPNLRNQLKEALLWHLAVAYLTNKNFKEANSVFAKLQAIESPKYDIGTLNKWKFKTQVTINELFDF